MSYATLLAREEVESYYLVILKPRRIVSDWTLDSGSKYTASFSYGDVAALHDSETALDQATSAALSDGDWYHDPATGTLTIDIGGVLSDNLIVATYELYLSTAEEMIFHRDPSDEGSREVYFEPIIVRAPDIVASVSDQAFGFMPSQSTRITLTNAEHRLEPHVYDSSFSKAEALVYHGLGPLRADNLKLLFTGICGDVSYEEDRVSIKLFDATQAFDKEYRFDSGVSYYPEVVKSGRVVDPNYVARPVRAVYGKVDGLVPVNIDYNAEAPTTSNNRYYVCAKLHAEDENKLTAFVTVYENWTSTRVYVAHTEGFVAGRFIAITEITNTAWSIVTAVGIDPTLGPYLDHTAWSGTVTDYSTDSVITRIDQLVTDVTALSSGARTYVRSVVGFSVGDELGFKANLSDAYNDFATVTAIGANYLDHTTITPANPVGYFVIRPRVSSVSIRQDETVHKLKFGRDYEDYVATGTVSGNDVSKIYGFMLTSSMETNRGMTRTLSPSDQMWCTVYGFQNNAHASGVAFGSDSTTTGNLTNGIVILYILLSQNLGIPESEIDTAAFQALEPLYPEDLSFAVPGNSRADFPTFKDLISDICQSLLVKVYKNPDNKWTIAAVGPVGTGDRTVSLEESAKGSLSYQFDYSDTLSDVIVEYAPREIGPTGQSGENVSRVMQTSAVAKNLHKISKQKTFPSLLLSEADATVLAERLSYMFGDRQGKMRIRLRDSYLDTDLAETVDVTAEKLPGFTYENGTEHTRSFAVQETNRTLRDVTIELNDQKGIEDNAGDW